MAQWLDRIKFGNGSNGAPSSITNYFNTFTGTAGQTTGTIVAGWVWDAPVLIHQSQGTGAGQWELNWGTVSSGATITLKYPLSYSYGTGAQIVTLHQYTGGTFSGTHTGTAWNGSTGGIVALMCNGDLTISGSISVNASGFRGDKVKINDTNNHNGVQGEGYTGIGTISNSANTVGGGGGLWVSNDKKGGGGGGGYATSGENGATKNQSTGGTGGGTAGNVGLTSMVFGGGGGQGAYYPTTPSNCQAGNGGGIVLIIAKSITVSGSITSSGQLGQNSMASGGGTGSGAGGSILIKCQIATLGTNKLIASGGVRTAEEHNNNGYGGAGGVGRIHIDYKDSYTGTTTPTINAAQDTNLKSQVYGSMI